VGRAAPTRLRGAHVFRVDQVFAAVRAADYTSAVKLIVCVVSVGQAYRPQLERLYESLPPDTGLSVLSDLDQGNMRGSHVFWHRLNRSAVHPIHRRFDWRLKAEALKCGFSVPAARPETRYLYLDCDCFFADPSFRVRQMVAPPNTDIVTLRLRGRLLDDTCFEYASQMRQFINTHGTAELRAALPGAWLPLEQAILIERLTPMTRSLPDWWLRLADLAQSHGMHGDPDAVDLGLALELTGATYHEADPSSLWLRAIHFIARGNEHDLRHEQVLMTPGENLVMRDRVATCVSRRAVGRTWDVTAISGAEWDGFLRYAERERVAPLVHRAIKDAEGVPQHVKHALRDSYRGTAAHVARLRSALVEVLTVLSGVSIPVVLLKGASLTVDVWTDIGLRPWSDLDLLVDRRHASAAVGALASLGFRPGRIETTSGATMAHENELLLEGPAGVLVDLHWSLFDSPFYQTRTSADAIWHHTRPAQVQGAPGLVLRPEIQLLHLCGHLVLHHNGDELLWLSDVAELVTRYADGLRWDVVIAEAQRLHLVISLQRTVALATSTLGAPTPPDVLTRIEALQPSKAEQAVVQRMGDRARSMAAQLWFDLTAMGNWRERLAFARTRLFPSAAYMRSRYGVSHPVAVALSYPYRWVIGVRRGSVSGSDLP
jgi:Uncharacterised nucleotidyltransferase